jgi:type I restriction enzyme M protein
MRGFARGSDGLADIGEDDTAEILVPILTATARAKLKTSLDMLRSGRLGLSAHVSALITAGTLSYPEPDKRSSHVVLV